MVFGSDNDGLFVHLPSGCGRPTVMLSTTQTTVSGPFSVKAEFNERVFGLTLATIEVINGNKSNPAQQDDANYSFTVTPNLPGEVKIVIPANVCSDQDGKGNLASDTLVVNYEVEPLADVDLELTAFSSNKNPLIYTHFPVTFRIRNNSDQLLSNATVHWVDPPSGVVPKGGDEYSLSQGIVDATGWQIGPLAAGATASITLNYFNLSTVPKTVYAQVIAQTPGDTDSEPNNGTPPTPKEDDEAAITINGDGGDELADLELSFGGSTNEELFINGDVRLTLTNKGPNTADNIQVRLVDAPFLSYLQFDPVVSQGTVPTPVFNSSQEGTIWEVGTLPGGAEATLELELFRVDQSKTAYLFAEVFSSSLDDPDSAPGNDKDFPNNPDEDDETRLIIPGSGGPPADLELSKTANKTKVGVGEEVIYNIFVENAGNYPSDNVTVKDLLPNGLSFLGSTASTGEYNPSTGIWDIGYMSELFLPNAPSLITQASLEIRVRVDDIQQTITNFAQIQTGFDIDATPGNDTDNIPDEDDEAAVTIQKEDPDLLPDLTLANLTNFPSIVEQGEIAFFNFDLINQGAVAVEGDYLISAILSTDSNVGNADDVELGFVPTGNTGVGTIAGVVGGITLPANQPPGNYLLFLFADSENVVEESNESNNFLSTNITVEESIGTEGVDLELNAISSNNHPAQWSFFELSIVVTNNGNQPCSGILVHVTTPDGLVLKGGDEYTATQGDFSPYGENIWELGTLNGNSSAVLDLNYFNKTTARKTVFAQVIAQDQADLDSTPNNNSSETPVEDDEAAVILNDWAANSRGASPLQIGTDQLRKLKILNTYPTVTSQELTIVLSSIMEGTLLQKMYSAKGYEVSQQKIAVIKGINEIKMDVSPFPSGLYYILFLPEGSQPAITNFVKQGL